MMVMMIVVILRDDHDSDYDMIVINGYDVDDDCSNSDDDANEYN